MLFRLCATVYLCNALGHDSEARVGRENLEARAKVEYLTRSAFRVHAVGVEHVDHKVQSSNPHIRANRSFAEDVLNVDFRIWIGKCVIDRLRNVAGNVQACSNTSVQRPFLDYVGQVLKRIGKEWPVPKYLDLGGRLAGIAQRKCKHGALSHFEVLDRRRHNGNCSAPIFTHHIERLLSLHQLLAHDFILSSRFAALPCGREERGDCRQRNDEREKVLPLLKSQNLLLITAGRRIGCGLGVVGVDSFHAGPF